MRRLLLAAAAPGVAQRIEWDAITGGGKVAPDGGYRIRIRASPTAGYAAVGRSPCTATPIRSAARTPTAAPPAPSASGATAGAGTRASTSTHPCGTPIVAARGGRVVRAGYDPVLYGNFVIIRGERTQRDYWYSHLKHATRLKVGDPVRTGQRIGSVGATGNARTIGCHLHFEIHSRGTPIDPAPELHAWDAWS